MYKHGAVVSLLRIREGYHQTAELRGPTNLGWVLSLIAAAVLVAFQVLPGLTGRAFGGAGPVSYYYDNGNRLVAVTDGSGNGAEYQYDNARPLSLLQRRG